MADDHEFRRAIEEIKLRAPIESIVAESVDLKARGALLWGCCPFHEERTPSFKVDPREGNWYCFGACRTGGDVIRFVQERGGMTFMDALELLASQTGVELPRRKPRRTTKNDPGLAALEFAERYFRSAYSRPGGKEARAYVASRGFGESAVEAFGIGWAPRSGQALVDAARSESLAPEALLKAGLVRRSERGGELYSFFRGRLMIPIRDERGTTVAFGGRLVGDEDGPKYVNSSETEYFHKGRVIYALDRAIETVRRTGHLILVEGYTDVIAAHAAGQPNVGAVLGTATTEMHSALVRRAGTRRVSLVFDGDEAGRRAAWRGLEGLLPLEMELEVVPMPEGVDPADLLMGPDGVAAFSARIESGMTWFEFIAEEVQAKREDGGRALAREVDRALELFQRLPRPVEIDTAIVDLADVLGLPAKTLRAQFESMGGRRRRSPDGGGASRGRSDEPYNPGVSGALSRSRDTGGAGASARQGSVSGGQIAQKTPLDPAARAAYGSLAGAALVDSGLIPRLRPWIEGCPATDLAQIFQTLVDLWDHEGADITAQTLINALAGHPARDRVAGLMEDAGTADDPERLFQEAVEFLEQREQRREFERLTVQLKDLEARPQDPGVQAAIDQALQRLSTLRRHSRH